ncbi:transglycosylase domain-containing protein [Bacillus cytotoxicus]|uniref:transglycosylase domain-containing protein n=1 Tax=Bacillus cytotoxicus TaxID=580165 RepID=UPI000B9723A4|nr:PBP1A family penicillin-binding protein [Bacillus cytotoxicus]AWC30649.1 monofunctional biosynthetic peptidoglycan transglycosylase [Bacillus cytotoxicus]AWC42790.1 monofunctional biosynthetic peptidoglycan transglycosylase [Bacillus cytotoxicus]AWC50721.1 monofunctional biosynthetic peptidoglycan transglycosylase [Bacillus cytotoxicus]AWC54776.1 monofunctional biosynthetic peptidoglycan transglycosylase [Bacillus cytotoxicus]AWC58898.1 monofunctional biosynthetic peptidoglycan transglycosy
MDQTINSKLQTYKRLFFTVAFSSVLFFVCSFFIIIIVAKIMGPPPTLVPQTSIFYANDDTVMGQSNKMQKRYNIPLEQISPYVKEATLSIEDQRFYNHHGFDTKRIIGAIIADIKAMAKVQGASTITQQYARNLYLDHDKTWKRKLLEAIYTIRLEVNYSKDRILEGYLNTIYYGHGAYGIEAAAQLYFNKAAKDLTLAEASMLAGIPKGPSLYSPYLKKERAKQRQSLILNEMVEQGYITKQQAEAAKKERLSLSSLDTKEVTEIAPYFQDAVQAALLHDVGLDEQTLQRGGLRIYTTLDPKLQSIAEQAVKDHIPKTTDIQTALVSMNPKTGEVAALVGGKDYKESQFNRAIQAARQPGSTFKPFLYYAALEKGFTPATRLKSEYTVFTLGDGVSKYQPKNYKGYYADDFVTMAQALAVSDNVYAVKTNLFLGTETLIKTAKQFGITSSLQDVPSLALGTSPVKPIEMVNAYSMFANGGKQVKPAFIRRVVDYEGNILYDAHLESKQVLDKNKAFVMEEMMTGMFNKKLSSYAAVTGQSLLPKLSRTYAGKSGSTETDSWMIGFTPQLVTGVWVGYDQPKPISNPAEQGYAKRIWADTMEKGLDGQPKKKLKQPSDVIALNINPENGKIATKGCPTFVKMYFTKGTEPTEYCMDHVDDKKDFEKISKEKKKDSWWKKYIPW